MPDPTSLLPFAPASKSTLVESVVEQIIAHIRDRRYRPGDRLPPERALMQTMHVGRSTIREALQSLAAMDLIETRSGSGSVVKDTYSLQLVLSGEGGMIDPHYSPASPMADRATSLPSRPQYTIIPTPSLAELEAGLRRWAALRPQHLSVDRVGASLEGRPILLCRITDTTVPDDDKQVVVFTTCHSGMERRAVSSLLKLIRWLVGDDPLAETIRRRQVVLAMPVCEPDGYESNTADNTSYYTSRHGQVYIGWTWNGPEDPLRQPEAMAVKRVLDEYRPDVHQDVHGMWYTEATQWENTGISWASNLYRSYVPGIPQQMNAAAEQAGFLMCGGEADARQILSSVPVPGAERWFFGASSTPKVVAGLYAYYHYHTIAQVMDAGWDESCLIRMRRLLEMGTEVWRGELYPGYPTHQVGCYQSVAIAAWGATAAERRRSRVELWRKLPQLAYTCAHPEPRDSSAAFVSTHPDARARYCADTGLETVLARLQDNPRFDARGLDDYLRQSPARSVLYHPLGPEATTGSLIEHGLAIRLLIGYPDVRFTHLKLDGHDLHPSETDGYTVYHNPGTIVQVNIPPGKVQDFHVVTAVYQGGEERASGFLAHDWQLD